MNELTQRGIAALKSGDRAAARQLLTAAIKQDNSDTTAWLWLTGTLDKDEDRIACLQQVLKLDPGNQPAARGLAQLMQRRSAQQAQAAPTGEPALPSMQVERQPDAPASAAAPLSSTASMAVTASAEADAEPGQPSRPAARRRPRPAADSDERVIFRSRPSLVPALLCFWLFLFGAFAVAALLNDAPDVGLPLAAGLGLILEAIVIYAVIRVLAVRYELTSQQLTLRWRGKRTRIPIKDIYNADLSQSFIQRLIGIGNIDIDAAVGGELAHLQMRNIPHVRQRIEQIQYLVRDNAPA